MRNPWFVKKNNNVNEFHELIESHVDGMYGVALRYTRNPQRAEDLVHDTVVRALRFEDRFEIVLRYLLDLQNVPFGNHFGVQFTKMPSDNIKNSI